MKHQATLTVSLSTIVLFFFCRQGPVSAQTPDLPIWQTTQVNVHIGFALPQLQAGKELLRARNLRNAGLSYYEDLAGEHNSVGTYPALRGITFGIAFYKPVRRVNRLMAGARLINSQTGTEPGIGRYAEAYYFNYLLGGLALKYYPFGSNNLFLNGDVGIASVFTKNRYLNSAGEQNFLHQFGIGSGFNLGLGYDFTVFKQKQKAISVNASYQFMSTRVEVNDVGDDQWRFGSLQLTTAITF